MSSGAASDISVSYEFQCQKPQNDYETSTRVPQALPVPSSKFYQAREWRNKLTQMDACLLAKSHVGQAGDAGKHKRGTGSQELRQ